MSFIDRFKRNDPELGRVSDLIIEFVDTNLNGEKYSDGQRNRIKAQLEKFAPEYMKVWRLQDGKGIKSAYVGSQCEPVDGLLHEDNPLFNPFMNPLNGLDSKYESIRASAADRIRRAGLDKVGKEYFELIRSAKGLAQGIAEADPDFSHTRRHIHDHLSDVIKRDAFTAVQKFAASLDKRCEQLKERTSGVSSLSAA